MNMKIKLVIIQILLSLKPKKMLKKALLKYQQVGTFGWAILQMQKGHIVVRSSVQRKDIHCIVMKNNIIFHPMTKNVFDLSSVHESHLLATDWEIYKPGPFYKDLLVGQLFKIKDNLYPEEVYQKIDGLLDNQLLRVKDSNGRDLPYIKTVENRANIELIQL